MFCSNLCCDPYKLTYVSAIITAVEAVLFGSLNLTLILMIKCVIWPPDHLGAGLDSFYAWYFLDKNECIDRHGNDSLFDLPDWAYEPYPLADRPSATTVESNLTYQIIYLSLHTGWVIAAFILLYGNARKLWGYYIPWLLISLTLIIMDVVIAAFFIKDMTETSGMGNVGPMIWSFAMYLRAFIFWFMNVSKAATATNAFCKSRHKRTKQERLRKKEQKKHNRELAETAAASAAEARAKAQAEAIQPSQNSPPPPTTHHNPMGPDLHGEAQRAFGGMSQEPYPPPPAYSQIQNPVVHRAPKEVRPFSYLNPSFRPNDPHDVIGMKTNPSPDIAGASEAKGQNYFSAVPPIDYEEDGYAPSAPAHLPRVNLNVNLNMGRGGQPYR